jgi:hypothetical protein
MDLLETILVTMLASLASRLIGAIWVIVDLLVHIVINVSTVSNWTQICTIDIILAKRGCCLVRYLDYSNIPDTGIHFLITRKWIFPTGFLMAIKSETVYTLYWCGSGIKDLRYEILGDPNQIFERIVNVMNPSGRVTIRRILPPGKPMSWQKTIIDQLLSDYHKSNSARIIISGPPGCGKTTIGSLIANCIKSGYNEPVLVSNMNFQIRDLDLSNAFNKPTVSEPIILMLNEFDGAIKYAERQDNKTSGSVNCLADSPGVLLNVIDQLSTTPYLIVIATTNLPITEITSGIYGRYTRPGRFDYHFEVHDQDVVRMVLPSPKKFHQN